MANILLAFQGAGLDLAESLAGVAPAGGHFPEGHLPSVRRTMGIVIGCALFKGEK